MYAIPPAMTIGALLTWLLVEPLAEPDARPAPVLMVNSSAGGGPFSDGIGPMLLETDARPRATAAGESRIASTRFKKTLISLCKDASNSRKYN
jgi:hypothetical protein